MRPIPVHLQQMLTLTIRYGAAIRKRSKFAVSETSKLEQDTNPQHRGNASTRRRSSSEDEELALDEQAGVLDRVVESGSFTGSPYINAHGAEKAEGKA